MRARAELPWCAFCGKDPATPDHIAKCREKYEADKAASADALKLWDLQDRVVALGRDLFVRLNPAGQRDLLSARDDALRCLVVAREFWLEAEDFRKELAK